MKIADIFLILFQFRVLKSFQPIFLGFVYQPEKGWGILILKLAFNSHENYIIIFLASKYFNKYTQHKT